MKSVSLKSTQLHRQALRPAAARPRSVQVRAMDMTYKEKTTNVEYKLVTKFWWGEDFRCLGAGARQKKIVLLNFNVYSVGLYVEAERCARELGIRYRGGFFESDQDYCDAIVDGAFTKVLQIDLVRDVEGQQFTEALEKVLAPKLRIIGEMKNFELFAKFLGEKKLENGTAIYLMQRSGDGVLDVVVRKPRQEAFTSETQPDLRIPSAGFSRSMLEVFLGQDSVVPGARVEWAKGARALLESDKVKRDTRKGGSG